MPFYRLNALLLLALLLSLTPAYQAAAQVSWKENRTISAPEEVLDLATSLDGSRTYLLSKDGVVRIYGPEGKLNGTIEVGKEVERISAVGLQSAGIAEKLLLAAGKEVRELSLQFAVELDIEGAPFLGRADAPVTIVEFSDFQCSFCAQVKPLIEELMLRNPDKIKIVFKNFPLSFHQHAKPAALAAMAAQRQGKFWEMHDLIFAAQKELNPAKIREIAQGLKLDMTRFDRDITSQELTRRLEKDLADGQRAGVRGTPALFVNGMPVAQRSLEVIQRMIDAALE